MILIIINGNKQKYMYQVTTYVDNMSSGNVSKELTDPVNKHLYMRPENNNYWYSFKSEQ